jgi:hypothetical protein
MVYLFPNDSNNSWITKYNNLVIKIKKQEDYWKEYKKTQPKRNDKDPDCWKNSKSVTIHHIIPKSLRPDLVKNKDNLLFVPFKEHCILHYYLWKADPIYASQLWWICIAGRKMNIWDLPGGEEDYKQLKEDLKLNRKIKKEKL